MEEEIVEKAVSMFIEGYNCSEAVVMAFAEFIGVRCKQIPKIATGFGGGIGRSGSVCGALAGAIMPIGLKYGRNDLKETETYETCMRKSLEFL